jgi:hypothetical protein
MLIKRRHFLLGSAASVAAATNAKAWTHGLSSGGAAPTFDATQTIRGTARTFVDLSAMLASVPTGNKVTVTPAVASGVTGVTVNPWMNPDHAAGSSYAYTKRELAKNLTVTTSSVADGSAKAWIACTYKNGAGETGSTVTYNHGFNVLSAVTTWAMGAKTWARCGGPLISLFGNGAATAITSQKDKNTTATTAFEIFYGRLVWKSTDGTSTTYGRTRSVDYATSLTLSPFTVTLDNGAVITVTAVDGQWDLAPYPSAITAGSGSDADQISNTMWGKQFARGDVLMFEDGVYDAARESNIVHSLKLSGSATLPTAPSGWNVMDTSQTGWLKLTSRNPWGATIGTAATSYNWAAGCPDTSGTANTSGAGALYFRFTNLRINSLSFSTPSTGFSNSVRRLGWMQIDGCLLDNSAIITHTAVSDTPNMFQIGATGCPGGIHHIYVHDNWMIGNTIGLSLYAADSELVGNRIELCSEDAIDWGLWDTDTTTTKSKIWWNFIPKKWDGHTNHPDYMQLSLNNSAVTDPLDALYPISSTPTDASTFGTAVPIASTIGNICIPDTFNNHTLGSDWNAMGGSPTRTAGTTYQNFDGQGYLAGDMASGRFYTYQYAGNCVVSTFPNGMLIRSPSPTTRIVMNAMIEDFFWPTLGYTSDPAGLSAPAMKYQDTTAANSGKVIDSIFSAGGVFLSTNPGVPIAPTVTNCTLTGFNVATAATLFVNPAPNWSNCTRIQDVIDNLTTIGSAATQGPFHDKTKINHRERTFDPTILA